MKKNSLRKGCILVAIGINIVLLLAPTSHSLGAFSSTPVPSTQATTNVTSLPFHSYWEYSDMEDGSRVAGKNISIVVELTGELGNHLHHIAHGRAIQTTLWNDHRIPSHLIFRRPSSDKKYRKTHEQLRTCFRHLRHMEIHDPKTSSFPSQKTLDNLQRAIFGDERAEMLTIQRGSGYSHIRAAVGMLLHLLETERDWKNATVVEILSQMPAEVSLPFLQADAMINRQTMDRFYDDFRGFFNFDEEVCCAGEDIPNPGLAVFHFRNFLGELKRGKAMGMEELSATKVATEVFGPGSSSNATTIAIATRFPGHKAAGEYEDALKRRGLQTMWLTTKVNDSALPNSLSAMYDFCAMIRTNELVGMVRSTFVVWAALLGNEDGVARLYSVDSRATRKQFSKNGKPIFRTYNWTHPRLQRRIHFELYQADAVDALSA